MARHDATAVFPALNTAPGGAAPEWSACDDIALLRAVALYGANWELVRDRVRATSPAAGNALLPPDLAWMQTAARSARPLTQFATGRMRPMHSVRQCFDRFRKLVYANKALQLVAQVGPAPAPRLLLRAHLPPVAPGRRNAASTYPPGFFVGRWERTRPGPDRVLYLQSRRAAAAAAAVAAAPAASAAPPEPLAPPPLDLPIYSRYRGLARLMDTALNPAAGKRERKWGEEDAALRAAGAGAGGAPRAAAAAEEPDTHGTHRAFQPGLAAALALPPAAAAAAAASAARHSEASAAAERAAPGLAEGAKRAAALLRAPSALAAAIPPFSGGASIARVMLLPLPDPEALSRSAALRAAPGVPPPTPDLVAHHFAPRSAPYKDRCPWVQGIRVQLGHLREAAAAARAASDAASSRASAAAAAAHAAPAPAGLAEPALNELFARVVRAHVLSKSNIADLVQSVVGIPPERHVEWMLSLLTRAEKVEIVQAHTSAEVSAEVRLNKTANILSRLLDAQKKGE